MKTEEELEHARGEATFRLREVLPMGHVVRYEDMELESFSSMRGDYMISFSNPTFPDYLIFVHKQGQHVYTQVTKLISRFASHNTDPIPGLERI